AQVKQVSPRNNPARLVERSTGPGTPREPALDVATADDRRVAWMRLLCQKRRFLRRATITGLVLSVILALLLPARYESKTLLMPPDQQSGSGLAMLARLAGGHSSSSSTSGGVATALGGSLGGFAGDLLGLKSSGALFVDMLSGATIQDELIRKFELR